MSMAGLESCMDSAEVMMVRCMEILHHYKGHVVEKGQSMIKLAKLEKEKA